MNTVGTARALVALTLLTGCATYRGITSENVVPRTELRVRFSAPHAVTFRSTSTDTLALGDVIELEGRMITANADSIRLGVTSAMRDAGQVQRFGPGTTTAFALADVGRMEEVQRHTGRTIALVGVLVLGAALLIAIATYQDPPPPPPPEPKPPKA